MACKIERRTEQTALGHRVYLVIIKGDGERDRVRVFVTRKDADRFEAEEKARRTPMAA